MGCKGVHCPGCGDGGGGLVVVLIVLAVVAAAAWHVRHGIETGLEIAMWSIVGGVALGLASGLVYAGLRIRASVRAQRENSNQEEVEPSARTIPAGAEVVQLGRPDVPAIEPPRPALARWPLAGQWDEITPSSDGR